LWGRNADKVSAANDGIVIHGPSRAASLVIRIYGRRTSGAQTRKKPQRGRNPPQGPSDSLEEKRLKLRIAAKSGRDAIKLARSLLQAMQDAMKNLIAQRNHLKWEVDQS
jgi:hypothetical protein